MIFLSRIANVFFVLIIFWAGIEPTHAQEEFPPPQGKGRVVVVVSGHDGAPPYRSTASQIAQLGYDAVLFDANNLAGTQDTAFRAAIQRALQMPHAIPGKVGLVGFSQGGGQVLVFGSQMKDIASVVIAWYPATSFIHDVGGFVGRLQLPVLMLAGEADYQDGCCLIETARTLAAAAAGRQFELVTYPNTKHAFIYGGNNYNAQAYADGMQRTAAKLAQYLR
jgi:dienelactone hydrolase